MIAARALPAPRDLSAAELAGQLVCVPLRDYAGDAEERERFLAALESRGWGGVIVFGGDLEAVVDLLEAARDRGPIPPLATGDFERGLGQQFPASGTTFPTPMALAATGDPALARAVGRAMGRELAARGFHVDYAPVADLANEPENPIVGTRAPGGDPDLAAAIVAATVEGLQESGVAATVKHVPGHGRTTIDSHDELPIVETERSALETTDGVPFRAGIVAGARLAMIAHVAYPGLEPDAARDRPATFSPAIVGGLLREEWGFEGLVCSDALMMGAVADMAPVDQARLALEAGIDWLLYPPDPPALASSLARAMADDPALRDRCEEACARLFELKAWAGAGTPPPPLPATSAAPLAEEVAAAAVTAEPVDPPRGPAWPDRAQWVVVLDGAIEASDVVLGDDLAPTAAERMVIVDTEGPEEDVEASIREARERSRNAWVACAAFSPVRAWKGRPGLSRAGRAAVEAACGEAREAVLLNFSNPRIVDQVDAPSRVVLAYGEDPASQRAALAFLRGARAATGRRPFPDPKGG